MTLMRLCLTFFNVLKLGIVKIVFFFSTEYDLALSVMAASGKLSEFVAKQQEGKVHSTALGVWY